MLWMWIRVHRVSAEISRFSWSNESDRMESDGAVFLRKRKTKALPREEVGRVLGQNRDSEASRVPTLSHSESTTSSQVWR